MPVLHGFSRLYARLCGAFLCMFLAVPHVAYALDIAVVVSQRSGPYQAFADAFGRNAVGLGHHIFDAGTPEQGLDDVALARADLVVASGEAALVAALRLHPRPTLATMLSRERFELLRAQHPKAQLSAFMLDQPADRQMRLLRAVLPDSRRVGALFGTQKLGEADLLSAASSAGLELIAAIVPSERELIGGLETVLRSSDAFIAIPDPVLSSPSAARAILLTSYRFQKPIIAFSRAYVEAGALAAVFTTPELIAADAAAWLGTQQGGKVSLPAPSGPVSFDIAVNRQVARALGIRLADDAELRHLTEGGKPR